MASQGLARASLGLAWASLGLAQASGGADGRTNGRNFSPFYRTLSPIEAAAQKGNMKKRKSKEKEDGEKTESFKL